MLKLNIILLNLLLPFIMFAQEDLLNSLDSIAEPTTNYASATFKTTRVVSGHSVEAMKEGQLEFRISHRFQKMNEGPGQLWGIDQSIIFLSLEYGLTDWLELGVGRTPTEKTYNGFIKLGLWKQSSGKSNMPFSISYMGETDINSLPFDDPTLNNYFTSRLTFVHQLLVARKFTDEFSLQLSPTLIHRNIVPTALDKNDIYSLGFGGRYKFNARCSINFEYFYVYRPSYSTGVTYNNPVSLGVDIETGGHVFQIMVTNSFGMIAKHYIADNIGDWRKGEIHLGFNISRVFTLFGDMDKK